MRAETLITIPTVAWMPDTPSALVTAFLNRPAFDVAAETKAREMLADIQGWMDRKGHKQISDFRGKLSKRHSNAPWAYTHAQYAKLLMNSDIIVNNLAEVQ